MRKLIEMIRKNLDTGQIVLLLVLITVVGLTIGLSLISRTITDIRISSQIEQSSRAFSAAEAGVETALRTTATLPSGSLNLEGAIADYEVTTFGGSTNVFVLPLTDIGTSQTVWLANHNPDGSLDELSGLDPIASTMDICWGTQPGVAPSVLVTILYKDGSSYKIAKRPFDPDPVAHNNNFIPADTDLTNKFCDNAFNHKKTVNFADDFSITPSAALILLRLQPISNPTNFALKPSEPIPVQGRIITSVGQTNTGIVRKIQVRQGYPVIPALLDFTFYSEEE